MSVTQFFTDCKDFVTPLPNPPPGLPGGGKFFLVRFAAHQKTALRGDPESGNFFAIYLKDYK